MNFGNDPTTIAAALSRAIPRASSSISPITMPSLAGWNTDVFRSDRLRHVVEVADQEFEGSKNAPSRHPIRAGLVSMKWSMGFEGESGSLPLSMGCRGAADTLPDRRSNGRTFLTLTGSMPPQGQGLEGCNGRAQRLPCQDAWYYHAHLARSVISDVSTSAK